MSSTTLQIDGTKIVIPWGSMPEEAAIELEMAGAEPITDIEKAIALLGTIVPNLKELYENASKKAPKVTQTKGIDKNGEAIKPKGPGKWVVRYGKKEWVPATQPTNHSTTKEDKVENTKSNKTPAVEITAATLGTFVVSKEYLEANGTDGDKKKFIKDELVKLDLVDFLGMASKSLRDNMKPTLDKILTGFVQEKIAAASPKAEAKKVEDKAFEPNAKNKAKAQNHLAVLLRRGFTGSPDGKLDGQWLADFTGCAFKQSTFQAICFEFDGGTLWVSIPQQTFRQDQAKWTKVIRAIQDGCRFSPVQYAKSVNHKLPIMLKEARKGETL
jgi:hypothetical protein